MCTNKVLGKHTTHGKKDINQIITHSQLWMDVPNKDEVLRTETEPHRGTSLQPRHQAGIPEKQQPKDHVFQRREHSRQKTAHAKVL